VISPSFSKRSSLRIAQVAPLSESVPPKLYGGTERVVATLTDELVRQGHDVTLFASGDSRTDATLVAPVPRALRLAKSVDPLALHLLLVEQVAQRADEFDVIHFHIAPLHFSIARRMSVPHVTTLHGRLDLPEVITLYGEFGDLAARLRVRRTARADSRSNWVGTVYHGLPNRELQFSSRPGGYLAFLGRISPEKRVDRAIDIAKACGVPAEDRSQSGSCRPTVLRAAHRAAPGSSADRLLWGDRGRTEGCVSRWCDGVAVPDRLAGAVRPGHDRVARLWHTGGRHSRRLGSRNSRPRRHGVHL
jgi:hypothetical protein